VRSVRLETADNAPVSALRPASDVHAAYWVLLGVRKKGTEGTVGSLVPAVFEDYARVFRPAMQCGDVEVRWAEVASANGRVMHPAAKWGSLTGSWQLQDQRELWDREPRTDELPERLAERLAETLAPYTREADRYLFGVGKGCDVSRVMMLFRETRRRRTLGGRRRPPKRRSRLGTTSSTWSRTGRIRLTDP
jgi:hypothetical protein